jgi:hypothetical protein
MGYLSPWNSKCSCQQDGTNVNLFICPLGSLPATVLTPNTYNVFIHCDFPLTYFLEARNQYLLLRGGRMTLRPYKIYVLHFKNCYKNCHKCNCKGMFCNCICIHSNTTTCSATDSPDLNHKVYSRFFEDVLGLLFYFSKFQFTSHQSIEVFDFGWRVNEKNILILSCLQNLCF